MQFQPWKVITPLIFPLSHPFPKAGVNQQNYWNVAVCYRSLSPHDNISMDTELVMKGCMNWYHPKVTSGSYQGHWKVKLIKHDFWWIYLFQTHLGWEWVLQMTAVDTFFVGYHFTTHRKGFVCHSSLEWGGGWLSPWYSPFHTLPQRCSESTNLPKFSFSPHDNIWIQNWVWKMTWVGAVLYWGTTPSHLKITGKVKLKKKQDFLGFYIFQTHLGCRWLLQMTAADTFWPGTISPHIASMQFHPWGGGGGVWLTPCVPLITPISQSWIFKSKFHEKELLHTELAPYPASMFDATGMMRMATKSTLNNDLRVNVSGRSFETQTTVIYDVSALLWTISWLSNTGTLGDFIVKFKSIVKHDLTQGCCVGFWQVLHQQFKIIHAHAPSGKNCGGRVHIFTAEMPLPPKTSIHGVTKNKVQLNKMLAGAMMDPEFYRHATAGQMHSLSVAGTEDVPVEIVGATVIVKSRLSWYNNCATSYD